MTAEIQARNAVRGAGGDNPPPADPLPSDLGLAAGSRESLRLKLYGILVLLDCVAILLGFVVANIVRYGPNPSADVLNLCTMVLPIYLASAANNKAFGLQALRAPRRGAFRALMALAFTVGAILLIAFYLKSNDHFSRTAFGVGIMTTAILIFAARAVFGVTVQRHLGGRLMCDIVINAGASLDIEPHMHVIDAAAHGLHPNASDPIMLDRLGRIVRTADRVVVACPPEHRRGWSLVLKGANIQGEVLAPDLDGIGALGIARVGSQLTLTVAVGPLMLHERILKRALDLAVALPSLILLMPAMALVALLIKLESRGPVLFIQQRLGYGNRLFRVYKFRSMYIDRCDADGERSTERGDARVTRIGRIIRRLSVDELPQLVNVLMGNMSIVGPRPHALGSLAGEHLFWEADHRYSHRHASKPGLTGLAQVRGFRGATPDLEALINRLQADLEYQAGWTIWRDLSIILSTVRVLAHRNAF